MQEEESVALQGCAEGSFKQVSGSNRKAASRQRKMVFDGIH